MPAGTRELIHRRTRSAFRDACCDLAVAADIQTAFENEGFLPRSTSEAVPDLGYPRGGVRRGLFDQYTYEIDWSDTGQVRRLLNVFEEILSWCGGENLVSYRNRLVGYLERDGYKVNAQGRIRSGRASRLDEIPVSALKDSEALIEHLERIETATDTDPAVAISGAKAVIEATCKLVLEELGETYSPRADVPELVRAAQKALNLHPELVAPTAKGAETIKRILSNLSQVAIGVTELRNEYGPDHGRTRTSGGLGPRHAHLAVGCAATFCRLLVETLEARRT